MKTNLEVSGRAELTRQEVSLAIIEFLAKHHNYKVDKVVYEAINNPHGFMFPDFKAIIEIKGVLTNTAEVIHTYGATKNQPAKKSAEGYVKLNIGVFDTMRALLNERYEAKHKANPVTPLVKITEFTDFFNDLESFHPNVSKKNIKMYLHDKRQFGTNFKWDGRAEVVTMTSKINYVPMQRGAKKKK